MAYCTSVRGVGLVSEQNTGWKITCLVAQVRVGTSCGRVLTCKDERRDIFIHVDEGAAAALRLGMTARRYLAPDPSWVGRATAEDGTASFTIPFGLDIPQYGSQALGAVANFGKITGGCG